MLEPSLCQIVNITVQERKALHSLQSSETKRNGAPQALCASRRQKLPQVLSAQRSAVVTVDTNSQCLKHTSLLAKFMGFELRTASSPLSNFCPLSIPCFPKVYYCVSCCMYSAVSWNFESRRSLTTAKNCETTDA